MKKFKLILSIFTVLFLIGCGSTLKSEYESIQSKIMNMQSYYCEANVKYISNKGENTYDINQYAIKDGKYRIETSTPKEVKGNLIIFDGKMIWQYNPKLDSKISVGEKDKFERKEISLFSFLENHVKSKEVTVETVSADKEIYTILEAKIPGDNKYFDTEKLWINNNTKLPEKLIIYGSDGKERVFVTYSKFEYDPKIEENIFSLENIAKDKES